MSGTLRHPSVSPSFEHGTTDARAHAFGWFGIMLGHHFDRYAEGYRFGQLARALVKRYAIAGYEAKSLLSLELVILWTLPIGAAITSVRAAFAAGVESGDITVACYACNHTVSNMRARGDHLDDVWRETERTCAGATWAPPRRRR